LVLLKLGAKIALTKHSSISNNSLTNNNYHNYETGDYYGYNYRPGDYKNIDGSVCTNNLTYEEIVFSKIKCPIEGFSLDAIVCCDEPGQQFCCVPFDITSLVLYIPLGILILFLVGAAAVFICKDRKDRCKTKKKNVDPEEETSLNR